jgi:tRNA (mo5U34)-methyltransferase
MVMGEVPAPLAFLAGVGCALLVVEYERCRQQKLEDQVEVKPAERPVPDSLLWKLFDGNQPDYLVSRLLIPAGNAELINSERMRFFASKVARAKRFEPAVKLMLQLAPRQASLTVDSPTFGIGVRDEVTNVELGILEECLIELRPWKKGPLNFFESFQIDSEWRSDLKWDRILPHVALKGKVICDLGCGNGYFMFRMLAEDPSLVVGIDPNTSAFVEFKLMERFCFPSAQNVKFELLDGDIMEHMPKAFDVVFCLGVLYHTPDPIGMLRKIWQSMKQGGDLIVDCQGIAGEEPIALLPKKRYCNSKGYWFLPTLLTVKTWITRSGFRNVECFFDQPLTSEEQRRTEWAPISSLVDAMDPGDSTKTIEGYPGPRRFYLKCKK